MGMPNTLPYTTFHDADCVGHADKIAYALLGFPPNQMLFCGTGIGDRGRLVDIFRSFRIELHKFCKFMHSIEPHRCPFLVMNE